MGGEIKLFLPDDLIFYISMIRKVHPEDAEAIASIYNEYILHSTITFDTEPMTKKEMHRLVVAISADYPYFVYEEEGVVKGYCYAHNWKAKSAYRQTWEITLYLSPEIQGRGIGTRLLGHLIVECRRLKAQALIACITEGNTVSEALHKKLGFKKVSHFEKVGAKFGRLLDVVDYELILE